MVEAPKHFLIVPYPAVVDRDFQRQHVFQILKNSRKYDDDHCLKEAKRIVDMCAEACQR